MTFRIFTRTWWADDACTIPEAGPRVYQEEVDTELEARATCRDQNRARGPSQRGPRGLATEYEET